MSATTTTASGVPLAGQAPDPVSGADNLRSTLLGRAAGRWIRVFWPLAGTIFAGLVWFRAEIESSISSTPHPQIVYAIFAVVAVAAGLLGLVLHRFVSEHYWLEAMEAAPPEERARMMQARWGSDNLSVYWRLLAQTKDEPLLERQRMLEHELEGAEADLYAQLALPNLLSGSLVGLGLVGTFIGLLGTLHELSGVFAALGGGAGGGDAGAMFATMIDKLKGPMEGMGTAFVASLYGLLGSLVIGLNVGAVRRTGERMFSAIRSYATEQLYRDSGVPLDATIGPDGVRLVGGAPGVASTSLIHENERLRRTIEQWSTEFSQQVGEFGSVADKLGTQLAETVQGIMLHTERSLDRIEKQRTLDELIAARLADTTAQMNARIDELLIELKENRKPREPIFGSMARVLVFAGAIAGLIAAIGVAYLSGQVSGAKAPPKAEVRVEERVVPVSPPVTMKLPAAPVAPPAQAAPREVIAKAGDSLSVIATREGVPLEALIAANPDVRPPSRLEIGHRVKLPD